MAGGKRHAWAWVHASATAINHPPPDFSSRERDQLVTMPRDSVADQLPWGESSHDLEISSVLALAFRSDTH